MSENCFQVTESGVGTGHKQVTVMLAVRGMGLTPPHLLQNRSESLRQLRMHLLYVLHSGNTGGLPRQEVSGWGQRRETFALHSYTFEF